MLRTRLLTAAIALPALWLVVEFLPTPLFNGFIVAVVAVGLYEYFEMALPSDPLGRAYGIGWGLLVAAGLVWGSPQAWGAALSAAVIGELVVPLVRSHDLAREVQRAGLSLLGILYVAFFMPHFVLLRAGVGGWRWVLLTVAVAMGSDTGGYFAGRAFGRHKLAPAISPSKTVEGMVGAVVGAMVFATVFRLVLVRELGPREALVLGGIVSVLAQLGDLCESALKRAFGAKDSGWIIPGHGGILDRLDSLLFPVVFVYYYAALPRA